MTTLFAKRALLTNGWCEDVRFTIEDGRIAAIETPATSIVDNQSFGIVTPGIPNSHSHLFQRALTGHSEQLTPVRKDNFWTWREQMYRLALRITPAEFKAIARQTFCEMVLSGYTTVAEFHYLHRDTADDGKLGPMYEALVQAADESGIRLSYVPILYERAGFEHSKTSLEQRRFEIHLDEYIEHYKASKENHPRKNSVALGAHSLRAVTPKSLNCLAEIVAEDRCPIHIHVAEQTVEVDQCLKHYGARPVEWLAKEFELNELWCLVHSTHITQEEIDTAAITGAVVCICPSTEANLGDGIFPLQQWFKQGGRIAIGSDSQVTINPFEELRWLEYGQRLSKRSRNIATGKHEHVGQNLFNEVLEGGSLCCGIKPSRLQPGGPADLLVLDDEDPSLAGHNTDTLMDAMIFSPSIRLPISDVMVNGEWQVIDRQHVIGEEASQEFGQVLKKLWS